MNNPNPNQMQVGAGGLAQGPQGSAQQTKAPQLLKAQNVNRGNFPFLSDEECLKYRNGIDKLWEAAINQQDRAKSLEAQTKLKQITDQLMSKLRQYKGSQMPQQPQQGVAQSPAVPGSTAMQTQARPMSQGQQPGSQQQLPADASVAGNGPMTPYEQQLRTLAAKKVSEMAWFPPPGIPAADVERWKTEIKRRYTEMLLRFEHSRGGLKKLDETIQHRQQTGQVVTDQMTAKKQELAADFETVKKSISALLTQQTENRSFYESAARRPAQNGPNQQNQTISAQTGGAIPSTIPAGQQQINTPATPNATQLQQQQSGPIRPSSQGMLNPQVAGAPTQSPMNAQGPAFNAPRPQLPMPQQAGAFQQQQQPSNAPPQANVQAQPQAQLAQPVSSQPGLNNDKPVSLSHQAAVEAANRNHSTKAQPLTPQNAFFNSQRPDADKINNKHLPINKNFSPQPPQPVQMPPSRPTLTGATNSTSGVMGQPALQKQAPYLLQGQGDRVLDKKKLDELVRQVTGADGKEGQGLQPDVEEAVLQLADEFIDNVITQACKCAKARNASTLEIRDIQLVLERTYNIRIPGYATDEVRTVRKIQPAPGYLQKMNAIQAAKVMGGKTDV